MKSTFRLFVSMLLCVAGVSTIAQSNAPTSSAAKKLPPGIHEIEWKADGTASLKTLAVAGKFAEWCGKLHKGDKVHWEFTSDASTDMNVHYHEGKGVIYPVNLKASSSSAGTLNVDVEQDYCWMWSNKSSTDISIEAKLLRVH